MIESDKKEKGVPMSKFLVAGILQRETIIKVNELPIKYQPVTDNLKSIHSSIGGDAYNEAIALKWLGNSVDFFSVIGTDDPPSIINPQSSDIHIDTDFILPIASDTPAAVIFCDKTRKQQIFEDIKDLRDCEYDLKPFLDELPTADMVVFSNANFCRPLLQAAVNGGKKIALNIRNFKHETECYNRFFLENADILYLSDDNLDEDPYDFLKYIVSEYHPDVVILGQGADGVIIYSSKTDTYAHFNSVKTNEIVNTVGAGNALFSCFLHYYNKTGDASYSIKNAILFASYKIGFMGTSNGFMTEKQIEDWRELIWK